MSGQTFTHEVGFTVRFGDLDPLGHLNNVAVVRMFETGRVDFCHDHAVAADSAHSYVLAALHVNYRAQGFYRDELRIGTRVERVGRTSFTFAHRLWRPVDDATIADGEAVLVVLGPDRLTPVPVPDEWRERLAGGAA